MFEPLEKIDTSVIDELVLLKRDREVLAERLQRMTDDQGKVSDAVYQRVRRDYEARNAELNRKAAPLKDNARREYAKLKALLIQVESAQSASRLDKEELEFRNRLGEFEGADYQKRIDEISQKLSRQEQDLGDISAVRERFLNAFDSEADLTTPVAAVPPPPPPPVNTAPTPTQAPGKPAMYATADGTTPVAPAAPAAPTKPGPDETRVSAEPAPESGQPTPTSPPLPPISDSALPPPIPGGDGTVVMGGGPEPADLGATIIKTPAQHPTSKTVIYQRGRLKSQVADLGQDEFQLDPLTFIGRTPQNQVQVPKPSVSRRHAQVALTDQGYVLKDLGSENGTYVNGDRITERLLAEGDRVQIGTVGFVFHAG